MKILFCIVGASFRHGGQSTRNIGNYISYNEQIKASKSHIEFLNYIKEKYNIEKIDISISTYETSYTKDLIYIYNNYIVDKNICIYNCESDLIGHNGLFHLSLKNYIHNYDCIFYFRIDIYLKQKLFDIFNPYILNILFPCISWKININNGQVGDRYSNGHPHVNDMMLFIPKKYFNIINFINLGHATWEQLVGNSYENIKITYDDFDCMLDTYHDSNSETDWNPLYYTVNRYECSEDNWQGKNSGKFDKKDYNYMSIN